MLMVGGSAEAQLADITQISPTVPGGAINKSFTQEIGAGRGNILVPDSSLFIIARDPFRAVRRGRQIFQRKFQVAQGNGPKTDDGVGNPSLIGGDPSRVAGLADSCAACHGRPRGSAGFGGDVVTRPDSRDAPHLFGLGLQEQLADEMTRTLRAIRTAAQAQAEDDGAPVTRILRAKGVNFGSITANVDGTFNTGAAGCAAMTPAPTPCVVGVDPDLRIRPFFAQGGTISIREFLVGAFNAEMGLEGADPDLILAAAGGTVLTPAGMLLDGQVDKIEQSPVGSPTTDGDFDEVPDEIPVSIIDFMEFYLLNYFKAGLGPQTAPVLAGRAVFTQIGCNSCHLPTFTISRDRRVADLDTVFDPVQGNPLNRLFATGTVRVLNGLAGVDDFSGFPTLKIPAGQPFVVNNIFTDFKRHNLGNNFAERNYEGTFQDLFITEPLWGVGTTPTYGHDGRSNTLEDVILRHGGEAQVQRDAFAALSQPSRDMVTAFLQSLILFPPDDTASNLQPKNEAAPRFPQNGHGAIALTPLFNNPADLE
ncbi:MAG: thiol oxidoreductase-like protein [Deltaproteobacteria bacterium]|nr:thiol oxidoreductase-like protein [Deltaproteobacteria bacterium]